MQILHIDSSVQGAASVSRGLTVALVQALREQSPGSMLAYHDLVADPIPHLNGAIAAGFRDVGTQLLDDFAQRERARSESLLTEFLASDIVVLGAPMYNFSVPGQLKAWLDRIVQPGRTFRFSPAGATGMANSVRVIVVSSRGGMYHDTVASTMDFQEKYLSAIFGFIGITDVRFVRAEAAR